MYVSYQMIGNLTRVTLVMITSINAITCVEDVTLCNIGRADEWLNDRNETIVERK